VPGHEWHERLPDVQLQEPSNDDEQDRPAGKSVPHCTDSAKPHRPQSEEPDLPGRAETTPLWTKEAESSDKREAGTPAGRGRRRGSKTVRHSSPLLAWLLDTSAAAGPAHGEGVWR